MQDPFTLWSYSVRLKYKFYPNLESHKHCLTCLSWKTSLVLVYKLPKFSAWLHIIQQQMLHFTACNELVGRTVNNACWKVSNWRRQTFLCIIIHCNCFKNIILMTGKGLWKIRLDFWTYSDSTSIPFRIQFRVQSNNCHSANTSC